MEGKGYLAGEVEERPFQFLMHDKGTTQMKKA